MIKEIGIPKTKPIFICERKSFYNNLPGMLHARMLLSCLADADYTALAMHYNTDIYDKSTGECLNPEQILNSLELYRQNVKKNSAADSKINDWEDDDSNNSNDTDQNKTQQNTDTENVTDSSSESNNNVGQNMTPPDMNDGVQMPLGGMTPPDMNQNGQKQDNAWVPQMGDRPDGNMGWGMGSRGSSDVSLIYSDDEYDS